MLYSLITRRVAALLGVAVVAAALAAGIGIGGPERAAADGPLIAPGAGRQPERVPAQGVLAVGDLTVSLTAVPTSGPVPNFSLQVQLHSRIAGTPSSACYVTVAFERPSGSLITSALFSYPNPDPSRRCHSSEGCFFGMVVSCVIPYITDRDRFSIQFEVVPPARAGIYSVSARVDTQNAVLELNESNNSASATFRVGPALNPGNGVHVTDDPSSFRADLDTRLEASSPQSVLRLPVLELRRASPHSQQITGGGSVNVEFDAQNIGNMDARTVVVQAQVPIGLEIRSANVSGNACSVSGNTWTCTVDLPAGGVPVRLGMSVGARLVIADETVTNTIAAEIDPGKALVESDEGNNTATATVAVVG